MSLFSKLNKTEGKHIVYDIRDSYSYWGLDGKKVYYKETKRYIE